MILAGCALALGLASCEMKNELLEKGSNTSGEMGMLDLSVAVNAANNVVTKASVGEGEEVIVSVDADGFELDIKNADGSYDQTHTYDPENTTIELPVGDYTVTAHTPGEAKTTDTKAYYSGAQSFTITAGEPEPVEVVCKMANTKIQVTFDNTLKDDFQSWTVTVTPKGVGNMAYPFEGTSANFQQPDPIYWMLPDNVRTIRVDFRGKNNEGNTVNTPYEFEKPVEADSEYWTAADALAITVKSEATTEDNPSGVNGVTIDAEVTWNELEDNVTIPVEGTPTEPTDPSDPDEPATGEDTEKPTLTGEYVNGTVSYDAASGTPFPAASIVIADNVGLGSIVVKAESTDSTLGGILGTFGFGDGVDLMTTDNETLIAALGGEDAMPSEGDPSYTFSVTGMISMALPNFPGTHTFTVTVKDLKGNEETGTLTFEITNSSTAGGE